MSASLVGSEMCIRDRRCLLAVYCTARRYAHPHATQCANILGPAGKCVNAVSYTHLTLPTICSV
eukprot:14334429-Alexandrium_andersonii.AAC.1